MLSAPCILQYLVRILAEFCRVAALFYSSISQLLPGLPKTTAAEIDAIQQSSLLNDRVRSYSQSSNESLEDAGTFGNEERTVDVGDSSQSSRFAPHVSPGRHVASTTQRSVSGKPPSPVSTLEVDHFASVVCHGQSCGSRSAAAKPARSCTADGGSSRVHASSDKRAARLALEAADGIMRRLRAINNQYGVAMTANVGIDTGNVRAGILGSRHVSYQVWVLRCVRRRRHCSYLRIPVTRFWGRRWAWQSVWC